MKPYQITWNLQCPQDKRDEIAAEMDSIKPTRAKRPISHARARAAAEARGAAAILKPDATEPHERASMWIRVYYRSVGGELLAFEHGPMRSGDLRRCRDSLQNSDSLGYDVWQGSELRPVRSGARVVVLPSQMRTEITEMAEMTNGVCAAVLAADGIGPHELESRLSHPPGEVGSPEYTHGVSRASQTGAHFRTAMARRGERIARWGARSAS